jgi:hypothetical protein
LIQIRFHQVRERSSLLDVRPIVNCLWPSFAWRVRLSHAASALGRSISTNSGQTSTTTWYQLSKGKTMSSTPRHYSARRLSEQRLFHTKIT